MGKKTIIPDNVVVKKRAREKGRRIRHVVKNPPPLYCADRPFAGADIMVYRRDRFRDPTPTYII